jgi:hypothetical protein
VCSPSIGARRSDLPARSLYVGGLRRFTAGEEERRKASDLATAALNGHLARTDAQSLIAKEMA